MMAVGIDMVDVARVSRSLAQYGDRFLQRVFTPQEIAYCSGNVQRLAGRFAIKEAVSKALGTGIGDVGWLEIEVVCNERGQPQLALHGSAQTLAAQRGLAEWAVSLSHTEEHAIGIAIASG